MTRGRVTAAVAALEESRLVYVHVKAPDLYSHDFMPEAKRDFLGILDAELERLAGSDAAFAIASDHTTDSNTGAHTADPVPVLFHAPDQTGESRPAPVKFGERACRDGNQARRDGHRFLQHIVAYLES